ncbi:MAG: cell division protein FtsZ [Bacteroidaceae bacterium]|nr:cell division protein FtsZ [Bacteroidaceae bacterium]
MAFTPLGFAVPEAAKSIIKVIGVGGGGSNAVNHMYREGINGVSFVVCNTDSKALDDSPVPVHLQLGAEGLGAGNKPEVGRQKAEESVDQINEMLDDGTKMVFITAGMGGGTGTGAAPVIAQIAREKDILTVGIVTIPFVFEGSRKIDKALDGVDEMSKHVDALLVINNERLRQIYPALSVADAFKRADDTLSVAAKSIAEITTSHGYINLDFNDVRTMIKDGGVAIISTGYGEGEKRLGDAIEDALNSPLLNDNDVYNSKKILLSITASPGENGEGLMMEEMNYVHNFMDKFDKDIETKFGLAFDPELGDKVKVTVLATGFGLRNIYEQQNRLDRFHDLSADERAKEEERERMREERRRGYYGSDSAPRYKRRPAIYIFSQDDLDNDDIISAIEQTPTYSRTRKVVEELKSSIVKPVKKPDVVEEPEEPVEPISTTGTISFANL